MPNILNEIFRDPPNDVQSLSTAHGEPILYAFECTLYERENENGFIYTAVNYRTGKTQIINRRKNALTTKGVGGMVRRLRQSYVSGSGWLQADITYGKFITIDKAHEIMGALFTKIMPEHGFAVRAEQISLAKHILASIYRQNTTLAEAEVGTGKTLAYLIPAIIAKRGRLNDLHNIGLYSHATSANLVEMPIVVATSSIALQKAILTEYIPQLSHILIENGIIKKPLTAVLRKGKEHYVCRHKLKAHSQFESNPKIKSILEQLSMPSAPVDLAEIDGLPAPVKKKICVPKNCYHSCRYQETCPYLRMRNQAQSPAIDIQVCNHNYLLADTLRRVDNQKTLIPNYQTLIIDEAHKFLSAARTMYGVQLPNTTLPEMLETIAGLNFKYKSSQNHARKLVKKLSDQSNKMFCELHALTRHDENTDEEIEKYYIEINTKVSRHLRNIRNISVDLLECLQSETLIGHKSSTKPQILWNLERICEQTTSLARHNELICWLEKDNVETRLCAIPNDLNKRLFTDLWKKDVPTILTSGTLSASGDFTHIKKSLGLDLLGYRLAETSKPSPFKYKDNTLLYLSENMPFPNQSDKNYIDEVSYEIERLIHAANGHAAVLFTSYLAMDMVWNRLKRHNLSYPIFRLDKGNINAINRFKESDKGILFASGAMWEGIDISGDMLSMLIIVKLPFSAPDPISEYEQTQYSSFKDYRNSVIIPEMLVKLKQGFGRLIRTSSDTGVVAILDIRASNSGTYHDYVINSLPDCLITSDIESVKNFFKAKKSPEYFK